MKPKLRLQLSRGIRTFAFSGGLFCIKFKTDLQSLGLTGSGCWLRGRQCSAAGRQVTGFPDTLSLKLMGLGQRKAEMDFGC